MRLPVTRRRAAAVTAAALAAAAVLGATAADAAWHPQEASVDVFAFAQQDRGGQRHKAEGLRYLGLRSALDFAAGPTTLFRTMAALSFVANDDPADVPRVDAITSASSRLVALDASVGLEHRAGDTWTFRPAVTYHHQRGYIAEGLDLAIDRRLAGGDATLTATLQVRASFLDLETWYGTEAGSELAAANAFGISWQQNLSPSVTALVGAQYTRQDGYLGDSFNYVVLSDADGPFAATSEVLPDVRHRGQVNARVRWSPRPDAAGGVDVSVYRDDWRLDHVSAEPSVSLPLPGGGRVRSWWRVSSQGAARYYRPRLSSVPLHRTQDSDLGDFLMNSAGVSVSVPRGSRPFRDELELSIHGFTRDDGIRAAGANAGFRRRW